jgi:hypothetical protein
VRQGGAVAKVREGKRRGRRDNDGGQDRGVKEDREGQEDQQCRDRWGADRG